jgi:hypothetical protein
MAMAAPLVIITDDFGLLMQYRRGMSLPHFS